MVQVAPETATNVVDQVTSRNTAEMVETVATITEVVIEEATEIEDVHPPPEVDRHKEVVEIEAEVARMDEQKNNVRVFASSASKRVISKETAQK